MKHTMESTLRTTILLAALTGLILAIGGMLGGRDGMTIALGLAAVMNFGSYWFSDKIVLRSYGAQPVAADQMPELHALVERLSEKAGLPVAPALYVLPDDGMNAFATGRNPRHAAVAVTRGLLQRLDRRELEGVMAHEIAHVRNRDVRLMTLAAVMVGVISMIADMLLWATVFGGGRNSNNQNPIGAIIAIAAIILAPIGGALLQMALSRRREYLADATAAELTGDPEGLARALYKLAVDQHPLQHVNRATAHLWIESPLRDHRGLRSSVGGLFDTHPPLQERIDRLQEMGGFQLPPIPAGGAEA